MSETLAEAEYPTSCEKEQKSNPQLWDISYSELASLTGASRSTIEHWFSSGQSRREPAERFCRRLAEVHLLWTNSDRLQPSVIQSWCR